MKGVTFQKSRPFPKVLGLTLVLVLSADLGFFGAVQYEVQFKGLHPENNKWMTRDKLIEMGMEKLVAALDAKEAAAQGLYQRPLTTSVVEKHLMDLGIEPEFGTHSHIRGLSGDHHRPFSAAPHRSCGSRLSCPFHVCCKHSTHEP